MTLRFPWMALLVVTAAAFCFVGGCNTDETDDVTTDEAPGVDITGSWTGTFTTADAEGDFNFTMTMDANGEVEGINTRLGRFTGDVAGNRFTIDATDFFAVISPNGQSMTGTFTDSETGDPASVVVTKD